MDSEVAFLNQRLDGLHEKADQIVSDIRSIPLVIPYVQNLQGAVDDIQRHAREVYNKMYLQENTLENTRMLGEATGGGQGMSRR